MIDGKQNEMHHGAVVYKQRKRRNRLHCKQHY